MAHRSRLAALKARIRFISEGEEVLSKASSYQPMLDDTAIATPTQKMAPKLLFEGILIW